MQKKEGKVSKKETKKMRNWFFPSVERSIKAPTQEEAEKKLASTPA